jgi:hypothetical protein
LAPYTEVAVRVWYNGSAACSSREQRQKRGDEDGAVGSCFVHKGVEEGRREGEESLAVGGAAGRARGAGPVRDGESILGLGVRLGISHEKVG